MRMPGSAMSLLLQVASHARVEDLAAMMAVPGDPTEPSVTTARAASPAFTAASASLGSGLGTVGGGPPSRTMSAVTLTLPRPFVHPVGASHGLGTSSWTNPTSVSLLGDEQ